ncbi:MAG: DUF1295 domain-containing protein [Pseudomonadota bacterium]
MLIETLYLTALAASLGWFLLLWPISVVRRDASVVDLVWGPGFGAIALLIWALGPQTTDTRTLIVLALVVAWAVRLGVYMTGRKLREPHEDPRYTKLRESWDPGFWWKSLFIVFLLQGFLQWLLTLPVQGLLTAPAQEMSPSAYAAAGLALAGLAFEAVADRQLARFKQSNPPNALCRTGLWAVSRHPNYVGEIVFWWAIWLICVPVAGLWTIIAPIVLTLLLRYVSGVPLLEEHLAETKPEFDSYARTTPMLLPEMRERREPSREGAP